MRSLALWLTVLGCTSQHAQAPVARAVARPSARDAVDPAPYTVLGWIVADIEREIAALVDRDVAFHRYDGMGQSDIGVWTTPGGDHVAWFSDTDGNVLSLTQFA